MMRKSVFLGTLAVSALAAGIATAQTLNDVQSRGELNCGVSTGVNGFSAPDANGVWQGFDVAVCRAVAAAVLDDPNAVNFVPTTGQTRFTALASGEVDMLARNTTWTFSRDVDLRFTFTGINYYDGQGFMVNRNLGVSSATELDGATVCIQTGTTTELNLADYFRVNGMDYEPVPIETNAEAQQQYLAGACDVYTTDVSGLAATRASFEAPGDHVILPEVISKEPLGPAVRHGDDQWADIVRWVLNALIAAEELGVTSANLAELAAGTNNPEINRLLGPRATLARCSGWTANGPCGRSPWPATMARSSPPISVSRRRSAWPAGSMPSGPRAG
jgi:general L-amino acid transport system substrate-binding protein